MVFTDRAFWSQVDLTKEEDLKTYVADYFVESHRRLSRHQEFELDTDGEIIYTSNNPQKAYEVLSSSDIYSRLTGDNDSIMLFHKRGFTNEIPESDYKSLISMTSKQHGAPVSDERFTLMNTARLQEGIPIIEKCKDMKLLVDDKRSLMNHLNGTCTYILREYKIN